MNTKLEQAMKKVRDFLMKKVPGFANAVGNVLKKTKFIVVKLFSFINKFISPKLQEAEGEDEDDKGIIKQIRNKLKNIIAILTKPLINIIFASAKKLAYIAARQNVLKEDAESGGRKLLRGFFALFAVSFINVSLLVITSTFISTFSHKRPSQGLNINIDLDLDDSKKQKDLEKAFAIFATIFAPIVEEIARELAIRSSGEKSFSFTLAIMLAEGIDISAKELILVSRGSRSISNALKIAALQWATRPIHMLFRRLHLASKYGTILAIIVHSLFNFLALPLANYLKTLK